MRLKKIYIDGFGVYEDRSFEMTAASVSVFYGPNEAGKTTLAEFIRTILFGFPRQDKDGYIPRLANGQHGGRLEVVSDEGQGYTFDRYRTEPGRRGGTRFTVVNEVQESQSQDVIDKLRAHQTREAFKEVYAFELDDLAGLKSDEDIYSAGAGASELPGALKELGRRQDELFKHGGSKQEFASILAGLDELGKKLREVEKQAASYAKQIDRCDELGRENDKLDEEQQQRLTEKDEKERLQGGWSRWIELQELNDHLKPLPEYEAFPENATDRLKDLEGELTAATERVTQLEQEQDRLKKTRETQITGEELVVNDEVACKEILHGLTGYRGFCEAFPKQREALARDKEAVQVERATLGSAWTDDKIKKFDISIVVQNGIQEWKKRLDDSEKRCAVLEHAGEGLASKVETSEREVTFAESKVAGHPCAEVTDSVDDDLSHLGDAKQAWAVYDSEKERIETMTGSSGAVVAGPRWQQVVGGLLLYGLVLVGLVVGAEVPWTTVVPYGTGIGIAVLLAYVLFRQFGVAVSTVSPSTQKPASNREAEYQAALKPLEYHFPDAALVGMAELKELERKLKELEVDKADLRRKTAGLEADLKERDQKRRELSDKNAEWEKEKTAWETWLTENAFPDVLTPDNALTVLKTVKSLQERLNKLITQEQRVKAINKGVEDYERVVKGVVESYPGIFSPRDTEGADVGVLAGRIEEVREQARGSMEKREQSIDDSQQRIAGLEDAQTEQKMKQGALEALMAEGDTDNPEEFRRRATKHEQRQALENDIATKKFQLRAFWNEQRDDDSLADMFSRTTKEQVDRDVEDVSAEVERVKAQLAKNQEDRGGVLKVIEGLEGDEQASELRQERAVLREKLRTCAHEWAVVTLAKSLLEKARDKHEEERQPDVVKEAEKIFTQMTGQRYPKLIRSTGSDREVLVVDGTGKRKTDKELSRGTRDQLYLSLRFGLIQVLGRHHEKLPVIVDDVLITSDRTRAAAAVKGFIELSKTNQLLVMTCHDWVVDLFKKATKDLAIVPLG